jgi:hypothetical protein
MNPRVTWRLHVRNEKQVSQTNANGLSFCHRYEPGLELNEPREHIEHALALPSAYAPDSHAILTIAEHAEPAGHALASDMPAL